MKYELSPRDLRHKERIDNWNLNGKERCAARVREMKIAEVEARLDPPPPPPPPTPGWFTYTSTYPGTYTSMYTTNSINSWYGCTVYVDSAPIEEEKKDLSFQDVVDKLRKGEAIGKV